MQELWGEARDADCAKQNQTQGLVPSCLANSAWPFASPEMKRAGLGLSPGSLQVVGLTSVVQKLKDA